MARELSFSLSLGSQPTADIEDEGVSAEITNLYLAINSLALQLDTATGGMAIAAADRPYVLPSVASKEANVCRGYAEATVDLAPGELVSFNAAGKLVKAQATASHTTKARAIVLAATPLGSFAPLAFRGIVKLFAGLTIGSDYYLSTTAGGISLTTSAGNTLQFVGFPLSQSEFYFCPDIRHTTA